MFHINRLKEAFSFFKRISKFHEEKSCDGSIIIKVNKEDGTITFEEDEGQKLIILNLKSTQALPSYTHRNG